MRKLIVILIIVVAIGIWRFWPGAGVISLPNDKLPFTVSSGFKIEVYAKGLADPRVIAFDPKDRMLVSETSAGKVVFANSGKALIENLDNPHGLAFYKTYIYIATTREVTRYPYDAEAATVDIAKKKNIATLPEGGKHFIRTIGFGKDFREAPIVAGLPAGSFLSETKLYISVGSSCDVCLENTWKYAAILETDYDGNYTAEVAGGLRNSEFFAFNPETGQLWATEKSRDGFPDEINIIEPTLKYGWPYCYSLQKRDESFTEKTDRTDLPMDCSKTEPPYIELPADADPSGIVFVSETEFLVAYKDKIVKFSENKPPQDFITGWSAGKNKIYGHPVDLKFDNNGNLFISDESAGIIYKISPVS